jgi:hypothetical protein
MSQAYSQNILEKNLLRESLQDKIDFLKDSLHKITEPKERFDTQKQILDLLIERAKIIKPQ